MTKVRNLPEITVLEDNDLLYAVDESLGTNGGRKIKKSNLKESVKQSPSEIKTAYESNADTNAFTDAEKTKLFGIETGATADQIASEVPYDNSVTGIPATNVQDAIDEVIEEAQADFRPSIVSGRILHYSGGTARFDDVFYALLPGDILLNPNITLGEVYVDLDGLVKQTGSGVKAPPLSIVFAQFSTDLNDIISLTDERVKNTQNLVRGTLADVRDVRAGAAEEAGNSGRLSDAMHKHNIITAAPVTQAPDQANAEGSAAGLARADHVHEIPTDAPTTSLSPATSNSEGVGSSFARNDHTHAIETGVVGELMAIMAGDTANAGVVDKFARIDHQHAVSTGTPSTQNPDQANAEGVSTNLSRADHVHNIPADAPTTTLAPSTTNAEGVGTSFARNDHTHAVSTALVADITTIQPDDAANAGSSDNFARGNHRHAIAAAAPTTNLSPATTNAEGVGTSFARNDHTHAVETGLVADITTIQPDASAAAGTVDRYARADHRHAIVADTPVDIGTANAEGAATSFARSNHVHNHGNQTTPTHHAAATITDNGFMSNTDKAKLDSLLFGFLSYTNTGSQSTTQDNTAFTAIVADSDTGSLANSLLTKTSTTQFRTDYTGYVRVAYKIRAQNTSANDVAWRVSVLRGGTEIAHTRFNANGKTNAERYTSASGSFILPCTNGDLITVGYSNAEAGTTNTITIPISGVSINVQALYRT